MGGWAPQKAIRKNLHPSGRSDGSHWRTYALLEEVMEVIAARNYSKAFWMVALLDGEQPNVNPNEHGVFSSQTLDMWHHRLSLFKLGLFSVCCPDFCIVRTVRCQIHSCHSTKGFNYSLWESLLTLASDPAGYLLLMTLLLCLRHHSQV